jgi:ribosomal 30S subunit maturation factor RimM
MRPEAACGAAEALALNEAGQYLAIARILRPQGRKGEVAAEILTDFPARFHQLQSVFLEVPGQTPQPVNVEPVGHIRVGSS